MTDILLTGCSSSPLASYLKGIGVLRTVHKQKDAGARAFWSGDSLLLQSSLDLDALVQFFLDEYEPSTIMSPWNGGSGFFPKDNRAALEMIASSTAPRFARYRECIATARSILERYEVHKKPDSMKDELIEAFRARMPDEFIDWIDASAVITDEGTRYPLLLGTGGNDGRLEFGNNYMQRLCDAMCLGNTSRLQSEEWLEASLTAGEQCKLVKGIAMGMYNPSATGGVNATSGFESSSLVNPWDYVLMMEGALAFSSSSVKRMGGSAHGMASCPFTVQPVQVGYASSAEGEEAKAEIWLPIWDRPCEYPELKRVFSEGRANVKRRSAANGREFALSISQLGVDRGISSFIRYGMNVRNGRSVMAVALGRYSVKRRPDTDILVQLDAWMQRYLRRATASDAPRSIARAADGLQEASMALCEEETRTNLTALLLALGECERQNVASAKWCQDEKKGIISPIPSIDSRWAAKACDGTSEFRIAAAVASLRLKVGESELPFRQSLEGIKMESRWSLRWSDASAPCAWMSGDLTGSLIAAMRERLIRNAKVPGPYSDVASEKASIGDVHDFLIGDLDDRRVDALIWALSLVDWGERPCIRPENPAPRFPGMTYAILRCYYAPWESGGKWMDPGTEVLSLASAGHGARATALAMRRMRAFDFDVRGTPMDIGKERTRRIAASLAIQVREQEMIELKRRIAHEGTEG
jgi:CRISPR-associated protein Csx17